MEKINNALRKTRTNVVEHKELYIGIAAGVAIGVTLTAFRRVAPGNNNSANATSIGFRNESTVNQTVIQFIERSTPSKPVHMVGTQKYWDSVHSAARDTGFTVSEISRNANGHKAHVRDGSVFEFVKPDSQ